MGVKFFVVVTVGVATVFGLFLWDVEEENIIYDRARCYAPTLLEFPEKLDHFGGNVWRECLSDPPSDFLVYDGRARFGEEAEAQQRE